MRTLSAILEDLKDGGQPTFSELYWSCLALDALATCDRSVLRAALTSQSYLAPIQLYEESFRRWKAALGQDPELWCGDIVNPRSHEYQQLRKAAKGVVDKIIEETP